MPKIAISGTYCTGKTTLSLALSYLTGIPCTHASTMREILPKMYPGKSLRDCSYTELLSLGMARFLERVTTEIPLDDFFISDGCPLQEWLYGTTRLYTGAYPDETAEEFVRKQGDDACALANFHKQLDYFGAMAKSYTQQKYDLFFHLPVEFGFVPDGHRPTSEAFRIKSEVILQQVYDDLGFSPIVLSGTLEKRLELALSSIDCDPVITIADAIALAEQDRKQLFDLIAMEESITPALPSP